VDGRSMRRSVVDTLNRPRVSWTRGLGNRDRRFKYQISFANTFYLQLSIDIQGVDVETIEFNCQERRALL
jgi:hypothetical protein